MADRSDDAAEVATAPEHPVRSLEHASPSDDGEGLESQILLARARARLLGWPEAPAQIGRYRVLERLGAGGMGVVYAAYDDDLDRQLAIKILRSELAPGSAGRQRLLREAQATARLSHPNVVHVFEVGQHGDHVYMAMELVRGQTLRAWQIDARAWAPIVAMYLHVGEGLVAAHAEGIVHRDFKPDNVLVGGDGRPQIVDFGLARASGEIDTLTDASRPSGSGPAWRDVDITGTGTVLGTPAYMAPEQLHRAKPDARCDQFSFCVALFEALYGTRPFAGSTYTELADALDNGVTTPIADRHGVPAAIHAIVQRGLSHAPGDRFASMRELLDELARVSGPRPARSRLGLGLGAIAALATAAFVLAPPAEPTDEATVAGEPSVDDPWAAIVAASELPPLVPTPLPDDPAGVTVHRLRNGLTIYVAHRPTEPMVQMVLAIRAGPAEEGADHPGLARLVNDAIRRGTDRIGVPDADRERPLLTWQHELIARLPQVREPVARAHLLQTIAAAEQASSAMEVPGELHEAENALGGGPSMVLGGRGAMLSTRQPANRVGAWLRLAAEAVQHPVWRGFLDTTATQLAMMGNVDSLDLPGRARDPVLSAATGMHKGGAATLDYLAEVPLADARRFHHERYRPNNAALVVVGDITAEQAVRLAEQELGAWAPAPIPATVIVDEPLPQPRTVLEIPEASPGGIVLTWPMPAWGSPEHAQLDALESALGGRTGLLGSLGRGRGQTWGVHLGEARDFNVIAIPLADQSSADIESVTLDNLRAVADDRVDAALWRDVLAESELDRLTWARGPSSLSSTIAISFLSRIDWASTAQRLAVAPTRAEVVAAAKLLLRRDMILTRPSGVVAQAPTIPALPTLPALPGPRARSPFVAEVVGAPTQQLEPRFLVAGSSYEERAHGAGRVITVRAEGPLFWLTWIIPVGTAEDRWACDATRARQSLLQLAATRVSVFCTTADTRIRVMAAASRFAAIMPEVLAWLRADGFASDVDRYASMVGHWRAMHRETSFMRAMAAENWALFGSHAMDAALPREAELREHGARALPAALAAMQRFDPDVIYVGPDPDALLAVLPPPRGATQLGPSLRIPREGRRAEVVLMHDPSREEVVVRAAVPWIAESPREQLAAQIHAVLVAEGERDSRLARDTDHFGYELPWSPDAPVAIGTGFRVAPDEVVAALETALALLRRRPSQAELTRIHAELDGVFRAERPAPQRLPELVYAWGKDGVDPRIGQWLALPSLSQQDLAAYFDRIDALRPALVVVGNLDRIDREALAELGTLIELDAEAIMLNTDQAYRRDASALMNE